MKRGYFVLIAGAILLVAGISISAAWGASFASSFMQQNSIVARTSLDAGKSATAQTDVSRLDVPLSLAVNVERPAGSAAPPGIPMTETVTDPSGQVVSNNQFVDSFFTTFTPHMTGTYTLTITNIGTRPAIVSGMFGHMPFTPMDGRTAYWPGEFGLIIVGGILSAVGVMTLIAGGIVLAIDSRSKRPEGAPTTEGGITYRKE